MIPGWHDRYLGIVERFGYSVEADAEAARVLGGAIRRHTPAGRLADMMRGRTVLVVGAGPSLLRAVPHLGRLGGMPKVVADGALAALMENGIPADVVVTDLDGDLDSLKRAGMGDCILVVHAHGDNVDRLHLARHFGNCIGTAQAGDAPNIHNFGGFTDGDRAVFLAEWAGAESIVMVGMDLGDRIGRYSFTPRGKRGTKIRKLREARGILEWLAQRSGARLYTTSGSLRGVTRIRYSDIPSVCRRCRPGSPAGIAPQDPSGGRHQRL